MKVRHPSKRPFLKLSVLAKALVLVGWIAATASPARALESDLGLGYEFYYSLHNERQDVTLLHDGAAALAARLRLIESAKRRIDLEVYIYTPDIAGHLVAQALARKAREGLYVRVVIDHWGSPDVDEYLSKAFEGAGIHLKVYNPKGILAFDKVQFRTHRKLLIVDNEYVITGGRNIADEYYAIHPDFNFLDRDVMIHGTAADLAGRSFDLFWDSKISEEVKTPRGFTLSDFPCVKSLPKELRGDCGPVRGKADWKRFQQKKAEALGVVNASTDDEEWRTFVLRKGGDVLDSLPVYTVYDLLYTSPYPNWKTHPIRGGPYATAFYQISKAQKSVVIENPYFIPQSGEQKDLIDAMKRNVPVSLLTNTFMAADSIVVAGLSQDKSMKLVRAGMTYQAYSGEAPRGVTFLSKQAHYARWGTHSKTLVVDGNLSMVGTWNFDPRSRDLNAEDAYVFPNAPDIAQNILADIARRSEQAYHLKANGRFAEGVSVWNGVTFDKRLSNILLGGVAHLAQDMF